MFSRKKEETLLDVTIDGALSALNRETVGSDEYVTIVDQLVKLNELKEKSSKFSKDNLASIGAHLLGILMIIHHEHLHPITSRAMQLLKTPKI